MKTSGFSLSEGVLSTFGSINNMFNQSKPCFVMVGLEVASSLYSFDWIKNNNKILTDDRLL